MEYGGQCCLNKTQTPRRHCWFIIKANRAFNQSRNSLKWHTPIEIDPKLDSGPPRYSRKGTCSCSRCINRCPDWFSTSYLSSAESRLFRNTSGANLRQNYQNRVELAIIIRAWIFVKRDDRTCHRKNATVILSSTFQLIWLHQARNLVAQLEANDDSVRSR